MILSVITGLTSTSSSSQTAALAIPFLTSDALTEVPNALWILLGVVVAYAICILTPQYIVALRMMVLQRIEAWPAHTLPDVLE
jgi:hypothetical protein